MHIAAIKGLLYLYDKGQVSYDELRFEIGMNVSYTGQDMAIISELESKGYILRSH